MIITLSPSKGQDFIAPATTQKFTLPQQLDQSQLLIESSGQFTRDDIQSLMNVSENIANLTLERIQAFTTPFTPDNAKQALFAFKGDVYRSIDVEHYTQADLDFAQDHLRILSGLYGYLRPLDLIQAYRLEMKTKLGNPRGENLYTFWGERITDLLNQDLSKQAEPVLVNLASNEYYKSVKPQRLKGKVLNINFKERKEGKTRIIAIFAKFARGMMTDWIIKNKIEKSEDLKAFDLENYRFDADLSDDIQLTFSRPQPPKK